MSSPNVRPRPPSGVTPGLSHVWTRAQRQAVFRKMVAAELRRGGMSRGRWQRLVQYSALLDLSAVEAGALIAEARESVDAIEPPTLRMVGSDRGEQEAGAWPLWVKVVLGCVALAVVDATVFHWVF